MNQVAIREEVNFDMILKDVETMQRMCRELMKTKHYAKMGEDGIFAVIQSAKSLGLNPLEALNGALYYIQGKVGMGSETMNALIRRQGHSIVKDAKSDNSNCILHGKRADNGDTWTVRFSVEDAKRAGLMKNMYDKYPGVMLYNRAMSMLARQLFPDVIHNAGYCKDELEEVAASKQSFEPEKMSPHSFDEIIEYISNDQIYELTMLMSHFDVNFQSNFMDYIKSLDKVKATKLEEIPASQFERVAHTLRKRLDAEKKKKAEMEQVKEEIEEVSEVEE